MAEQRLIDANNLGIGMAYQNESYPNYFAIGWNSALKAVTEASPTIDPETLPIVRQLREREKDLERQLSDWKFWWGPVREHEAEEFRENRVAVNVMRKRCEKTIAELRVELRRVTAERDAAVERVKHHAGCWECDKRDKGECAMPFFKDECDDTIEDILGDTYDLDHLRELVEADKNGRCFVSDAKLGGEVFYIPRFNGKPYCGIQKGHVQAVSFTKAGKRIKIREHHAHNQDFMLGKTVFLTYEAAEAALKGEQHECD